MADDSVNGNAGEEKKSQREIRANAHIEQLLEERKKLSETDNPIALRLIDEEIKRTQDTGKASYDNRYIDVYNNKPTKVLARVQFPTNDVPTFNFVGKLLGPKGNTLKHLQEHTKCKMFIFGKGSMRDKAREDQLRNSGDQKYAHLLEDLHVEVSCVAPPAEAYTRLSHALQELALVLVPDGPMDDSGYGYMDEMAMMPPRGMRGPMGPMGPPGPSKAKVMGFLEKARQSMEFQPRRFGRGGSGNRGGYDDSYFGDDGRWMSGYKASGGGFFPPRSAPYSRP